MTPEERAIFEKRRRGRNIALLLLLSVFGIVLFHWCCAAAPDLSGSATLPT